MSDPISRLNTALEGRYRIESQLGEGGMAAVYLADDLRREPKVRCPGSTSSLFSSPDPLTGWGLRRSWRGSLERNAVVVGH
jgi:serine/threonine protein kinase